MLRLNIDHPVVEKLVDTLLTIKITADRAPSHVPYVKAFSKKAEEAIAAYRAERDKVHDKKVRTSKELIDGLQNLVNAFDTAAHLVKLGGSNEEAALFKLDQQTLIAIIAELKVHHGIP